MTQSSSLRRWRWPSRHTIYLVALFIVTGGLAALALLMPFSTRTSTLAMQAGEVATQDVLAPQAITYTSDILTERQRDTAARNVDPVYGSPDTSIAREQVERLRAALDFIDSTRSDSYASREQKLADLAALQDVHLSEASAEAILELSESGWQAVYQEAIVVLEQVMRSTIREDRLEDARRSVPALVSLNLPEDQASLVAELVSAFITPNSFYSEELTLSAQEAARAAVEPVTRSYMAGETVVQRGEVITEEDLEALQILGLVQPTARWQEQLATVAVVLAAFVFIALYLRQKPKLVANLRSLTLIAVLFLIFLFTARIIIPGRTVIPYIFPLAAYSLIITSLFGIQTGMALTLPLSILAAYDLPNVLDLSLYYLLGGMVGALVLSRGQRISTYFWAGAAASAAGAAVIIAYRLAEPTTDLVGFLTLMGASMLNGLGVASLTLVLQYFLAQILGLTTTLQLLELSRPDNTLLQFILRNAPGTYQHSLQVANLAEQAAELIGADTLLTRVGALYHDAGKARHPHFFIENQVPGSTNPHDELNPEESAAIIIQHVPDGLELARKQRLPRRIQDFIAEHHGTLITRYQYATALEAAGGDKEKVDIEKYRYPGPRPRSRETGLVMLADGCEALTRAERPKDKEELQDLVQRVISTRTAAGQLDDTDLTMRDLKVVEDSFITSLRGVYHPRISYPKIQEQPQPLDPEQALSD